MIPDGPRDPAAEPERTEAPRVDPSGTGVIVVLPVPAPVARRLAVPGGVPPALLHLTLAALGTTDTLGPARLDAVRDSLRRLATDTPPVAARVSGLGRFSNPRGLEAAYVNVSAPDLPTLRERLLYALAEGAGLEADAPHGFTPHISVAYIPPDAPHPLNDAPPLELSFRALELWVGPHHDAFPLQEGGEPDAFPGAARDALGTARPRALAGVVADWAARSARELRDLPPPARARWVREGLDDLHTRLLAAFLASPARPVAGLGAEQTLLARARRVRSVETDLNLILGTIARDLAPELHGREEAELKTQLRAALDPILVWATALDETDDLDG